MPTRSATRLLRLCLPVGAAAALVLPACVSAATPPPAPAQQSPGPARPPPGPSPAPPEPAKPSPGCSQPAPAARFVANVTVSGQTRTALVNVPQGPADGTPLPLVLVFHSAGSNALAAEAATGFTSLGQNHGFISVYPNSDRHFWSLSGQRDYDFAQALLEQLDGMLCVDEGRVYATGVSNGASLVSRLGCLLSDRLAAIAPVAGDDGLFPGCQPTHPLSVLEIHGSADASVPYDGSKRFGIGVWTFLGAWARWDECPNTLLRWQRLAPRVLYVFRSGCADDTTIAHVKLLREEHAWPSLTGARRGSTAIAFSARAAIWQFFSTQTVSLAP